MKKIKLKKGQLTFKEVLHKLHYKLLPRYRIVGGVPVTENTYPWFCLLAIEFTNGQVFSCGASFLPGNYAISAAHCIVEEGTTLRSIYVIPNIQNLSDRNNIPGTTVEEVFTFGYNSSTLRNDIAIFKLRDNPELNTIPRARLSSVPITNYIDSVVTAIGFGTTEPGGDISNQLLKTETQIVDYCTNYANADLTNVFCTVAKNYVRGTCQGDSGGPIFHDNVVFGLISSGHPNCGDPNFTEVNTDIEKFYSDINLIIGNPNIWYNEVLELPKNLIDLTENENQMSSFPSWIIFVGIGILILIILPKTFH